VRLRITHLNSKQSFFHFNTYVDRRGSKKNRTTRKVKANFVDLRTFGFALTNRSFSLKSACEFFDAEVKKYEEEEHGHVTPDYIRYNLNDVESTYSLYSKMLEKYNEHNLRFSPTQMFSPASIGKKYLQQLGIEPFLQKNPEFPPEILGYLMTAFYGGRAEVRIRKQPAQVRVMDFLSMYPTVCKLQNLWRFLICDEVEYHDTTPEIQQLLDSISLKEVTLNEK